MHIIFTWIISAFKRTKLNLLFNCISHFLRVINNLKEVLLCSTYNPLTQNLSVHLLLKMFLHQIAILCLATTSLPAVESQSSRSCNKTMEKNGINLTSFANVVAHGIHSLYLEPLRNFFEPKAKTKNGIPVVNIWINESNQDLTNAPLAGYDPSLLRYHWHYFEMPLKYVEYYWLLCDQFFIWT